jgi:hypothetical protein
MKEEKLEPCVEYMPSDFQIILELQKTVCDYERFCGDLLFDLQSGRVHDHLRYNAQIAHHIIDEIEKLLSSKSN